MQRTRVTNVRRSGLITPVGAAAIALAVALSGGPAEATNVPYTWSGATSSDFATGTNWVGNTGPTSGTPGTGDPMDGDFAIFGTNAATVANQPTLGANFGVRKLEFDGSGWTLGGSATLSVSRSGGGVVTTNTTGTNTINANISVGTRDTAASGFNIAGSASDGVLRLNGTIGRFADNSGNGAVIKTGGGTLELNTTGGTVSGWQVDGGTLKIISGTGGFGTLNNVLLSISTGTVDLNGNSIGAGLFSMSNSAGLLTSSSAATFTTTSSTARTIAGKIGGQLNMVYANNGTSQTYTISNSASDYTGSTSVRSGSSLLLTVNAPSGAAGALGNATSAVQLGTTSGNQGTKPTKLLVKGPLTVERDINIGTQTDVKWLGADDTSTAGTSTFSGTINVGLGSTAGTAPVSLTAPASHQVDFTGQILEALSTNTSLGAIKKVGAGTVRFTNSNTYAGGTSVEAGTLLVDNTTSSGTGAGDVTVLEAATLGGNGAIGGSVILNADSADADDYGAILQPTTATNALNITGILTAGTGAVLDLQSMTGLNPQTTYTIVTYGSLSGTFDPANIINAPSTHNVDIGATQIQLTPVPEPTVLAVFGLGVAGLLTRRRRR